VRPKDDPAVGDPTECANYFPVMAGLVLAIHVFDSEKKDVDAWLPSTPRLRRATNSLARRSFSEGGKAGHDECLYWVPRVP
jgi:hypothetical protein